MDFSLYIGILYIFGILLGKFVDSIGAVENGPAPRTSNPLQDAITAFDPAVQGGGFRGTLVLANREVSIMRLNAVIQELFTR